LISLMKKGWQNVGTLHLKTSMGVSYRIFGWLSRLFKSILFIIIYIMSLWAWIEFEELS
jgi:hypothetical protein